MDRWAWDRFFRDQEMDELIHYVDVYWLREYYIKSDVNGYIRLNRCDLQRGDGAITWRKVTCPKCRDMKKEKIVPRLSVSYGEQNQKRSSDK